MGLYFEKRWSNTAVFLLLTAAFLLIYLPWFSCERELFREECVYAVEAMECHSGSFLPVTAHGEAVYTSAPLFPMMTAGLRTLTGWPIETIMRGISMLMLAAGAVLVYFAAASQRTVQAGIVAAAVYLTPLIALEKVVEGNPATTSGFFLLAAQLLFFYYGIRRSNWNMAWIISTFLIALGFLSGGVSILILFIAPMFFFRRPLSVKSKFNAPGFAVAVLLLISVVIAWAIPYFRQTGNAVYDIWLDNFRFDNGKYFLELLEFPLLLPIRLLPWTLIAWLPFCVALQDLDKTPIFSRYLRTLFFVSLALIWLFFDFEARAILFLLGPLSILTGITYELGTRRYGEKIRKLLPLGGILTVILTAAFVAVKFLPDRFLTMFLRLNNSLTFRHTAFFSISMGIGCFLLVLLLLFLLAGRRKQPLWIMLLVIVVSCGVFYGGVMKPYRSQLTPKRRLGNDLRRVLEQAGGKKLYKVGIRDLYGELFYTGMKVVKLREIRELPAEEEVVFLLGTEFPGTADRSWQNLLPSGYTYNKHPLSLWKGVLRPRDE